MRSNALTLVAFAAAIVFAVAGPAQAGPLTGSEWRPTEISGVEIPEDTEIFVRFEDNQVKGNGGCNQFFGSYEIDGDGITFGPIASTKMLCPDPAQENETRLFDALAHATGFARDGTKLMLTGDDDAPLIRLVQTDAD